MKKQHIDLVPHSAILMSIKREFSRSEIVNLKFESLKRSYVKYKIDGSKSKIPDVFYPCEHCNNEFKRKDLQCDHKDPVVPVQIPTKHMCWNVLIEERCFVNSLDKLQLLCKPCHNIKTRNENSLRKEWRKKEKHIVYITTNTVNGKRYIGVHKCVDLNDGYMGSGYALKSALEKYGKENFYRKVLYCYDNSKQAYDKEKELVTEEIVTSDKYYNLVGGGKSPGFQTKETIEKRVEKLKGREHKSKHNISVTAINLITGEKRSYNSISQCSKDLNISYSSVLKVCKRRYGMTRVYDWTFETNKYGKALINKTKKSLIGINKNKNKYSVLFGKVYLGLAKTVEEAISLQKEYMDKTPPKSKRDINLRKRYENSHKQALK